MARKTKENQEEPSKRLAPRKKLKKNLGRSQEESGRAHEEHGRAQQGPARAQKSMCRKTQEVR